MITDSEPKGAGKTGMLPDCVPSDNEPAEGTSSTKVNKNAKRVETMFVTVTVDDDHSGPSGQLPPSQKDRNKTNALNCTSISFENNDSNIFKKFATM